MMHGTTNIKYLISVIFLILFYVMWILTSFNIVGPYKFTHKPDRKLS